MEEIHLLLYGFGHKIQTQTSIHILPGRMSHMTLIDAKTAETVAQREQSDLQNSA